MGSGTGAILGAAYLVAGPAPRDVRAPVAAPAPPVVASVVAPSAASVRGPSPVPAAAPFRFAAVSGGASDLQCLTEAVYFEARGEPEQGQRAVAQVVLNRVRHPAFPKTICGVVHQRTEVGCQFSFACAPEPRGRDEDAWKRAQTVAKGALHGAVMREIGDATHFESVRAAAFAGLLKVAQIGEHVFYRFGGHAGGAGMFHQTPAPSSEPRLMMASLTEPAPAAVAQAQAAKPSAPSVATPQASAPLEASAATLSAKPVARPAPATGLALTSPQATTASAPAAVKPIPAATVKASVTATPVTQS